MSRDSRDNRKMMWSHATRNVGGVSVINTPYILLTLVAMGLSAALLWYTELPEVRLGLLKE